MADTTPAIVLELLPEEANAIRKAREERAAEIADVLALGRLLPRAKSKLERHQIELMIARRGGPAVATCKCGAPVMSGCDECDDCCSRAYGK